MKTRQTFEYDTDDADEVAQIQLMRDAGKWAAVVEEMDCWLRSLDKYEGVEAVSIRETRKKLNELLEERGLKLN